MGEGLDEEAGARRDREEQTGGQEDEEDHGNEDVRIKGSHLSFCNKNGRAPGLSMDPTMDCSICLAAIEATTSSVRTSCGHDFHFGCLATWSKTKSTCPLCRQAFTETETPDWSSAWSIVEPMTSSMTSGRREEDWDPATFRTRYTVMTSTLPIRGAVRRAFQEQLEQRRALRPVEWSVAEGLDPVDVAFVVEKAGLEAERAKAYLAFYKNPIDVIMLTMEDPFHIPIFRDRERGSSEPYVSRNISHRAQLTALTLQQQDDRGYSSS